MLEVQLHRLGQRRWSEAGADVVQVTRFPAILGRHAEGEAVLDHPMVSRRHCELSLHGDEVWVRDLGSRNGTFVNARPVIDAQPLADGDLLKLGPLFFHVRLVAPALAPAAAPGSGTGASSHPNPPQQVLVVEDDVDTAAGLARLLQGWGHDVRVAHDGAEALRAARARRPDTVLLDIRLPGMDGYQVAQQLRAQLGLGDAVLVGITGDASAADPRRSQEAGLHRLLTKPVDLQALAGVLGTTA
jgi:CheY-like chemotaxis protein